MSPIQTASDLTLMMAHLSEAQRRTFEVDRELDNSCEAEVVAGIMEVVDAALDDDIKAETEAAWGKQDMQCGECCEEPRKEPDPSDVAYCPFVLQNERCPKGRTCPFRHLVFSSSGAPTAGSFQKDSESADEALCCAVCQEHFVDPVTLTCGHSFDRHCLEHLIYSAQRQRTFGTAQVGCPMCRKPMMTPLPEVNIALREIVKSQYPHEIDARQADLRLRQRNHGATGLPPLPDESADEEVIRPSHGASPLWKPSWALKAATAAIPGLFMAASMTLYMNR